LLPELDALLALQRQDTLLLEAKRRKEGIPARRDALKAAVESARAALDQAKKDVEQTRLGRRGVEKDVEALSAEAAKLERQLHDVKTNKEYQALLHEIELVKGRRSDQETKILESFDREERLAAAMVAAERRLKEEEGRLRDEVEVLAKEEADLDQRIHSLSQDRDAVKPRVPATLLSRYDRLLSARDGVAVAEVKKSACGACFKALTPHALQEARRGDQLQICEACGRILVYLEPTAP
jgi:predicted  nucleic acid-binding Zn-ribbon protein